MKKDYQTKSSGAAIGEIVVPEQVSVAMSELAGAMREGLLALAVGAGLQVMQVVMEPVGSEVTRSAAATSQGLSSYEVVAEMPTIWCPNRPRVGGYQCPTCPESSTRS